MCGDDFSHRKLSPIRVIIWKEGTLWTGRWNQIFKNFKILINFKPSSKFQTLIARLWTFQRKLAPCILLLAVSSLSDGAPQPFVAPSHWRGVMTGKYRKTMVISCDLIQVSAPSSSIYVNLLSNIHMCWKNLSAIEAGSSGQAKQKSKAQH